MHTFRLAKEADVYGHSPGQRVNRIGITALTRSNEASTAETVIVEKPMANASKRHVGPGSQGKHSGTGAMTELPEGVLEENTVLSNRDKSQHSDGRGLDSKMVQTEQFHDHAGNRRNFDAQPDAAVLGNTSGLSRPMSDSSGDDSSLTSQAAEPEDR